MQARFVNMGCAQRRIRRAQRRDHETVNFIKSKREEIFMVFNWFFKDEFQQFYTEIERMQRIVGISEKDLLVDHFVELRAHFKTIKKLIPVLLRLYRREVETIKKIPESEYKQKLVEFASDLQRKLNDLPTWVNNGELLIEEILKIRVIAQVTGQKNKIQRIILHISSIVDKSQQDAFALVKIEEQWKKEKKAETTVSKLSLEGTLSNGWRLRNIQNVVLALGGIVKPNPGGTHPYKIVFPKQRSIPLATSTPPFLLVKEVSSATGRDNKALIASFAQGALVEELPAA
jgi:hypothetical protein